MDTCAAFYILLTGTRGPPLLAVWGRQPVTFLLLPTASMMPQRKSDLCKIVVRALFTGACVSFISACMAGILYVPRGAETDCVSFLNTNFTNRTYETYVCCRELFQSTWLNGTNTPSFSGPWADNEFSARNLASCCELYNSTVCV